MRRCWPRRSFASFLWISQIWTPKPLILRIHSLDSSPSASFCLGWQSLEAKTSTRRPKPPLALVSPRPSYFLSAMATTSLTGKLSSRQGRMSQLPAVISRSVLLSLPPTLPRLTTSSRWRSRPSLCRLVCPCRWLRLTLPTGQRKRLSLRMRRVPNLCRCFSSPVCMAKAYISQMFEQRMTSCSFR